MAPVKVRHGRDAVRYLIVTKKMAASAGEMHLFVQQAIDREGAAS